MRKSFSIFDEQKREVSWKVCHRVNILTLAKPTMRFLSLIMVKIVTGFACETSFLHLEKEILLISPEALKLFVDEDFLGLTRDQRK